MVNFLLEVLINVLVLIDLLMSPQAIQNKGFAYRVVFKLLQMV